MEWARLKSGDPVAFESIYRTHAKAMVQYGLKITDDLSLVQDCIQDLFIEIWKGRANLADTPYPRFYLFRALRNKLARALSRQSFVSEGELSLATGDLTVDYVELDIMAREMETQHRETLQTLLKKLPRRQQEAIFLRFYQNIPYEHIAGMMGMNYQSVLNLVQRALGSLRKAYFTRFPRP